MDGSEDSGDGDGGIIRIIVGEFGRVKCGHTEGHRIMEALASEHISEGTEE